MNLHLNHWHRLTAAGRPPIPLVLVTFMAVKDRSRNTQFTCEAEWGCHCYFEVIIFKC